MNIHGVIAALITPYDETGQTVDLHELKEQAAFLMDRGIHGIFAMGTAGEGILLQPEERKNALSAVVEACQHRVPVIAHVGHIHTQTAAELADHAKRAGADAAASVPPYYFPLDDDALYQYFCTVAEAACPLPFYVYNYPETTNNTISSALLARMAKTMPNLAGFKDSSKSLEQFKKYLRDLPALDGLVGSDTLALEAFKAGGKGIISTVANVFPEEVVQIYRNFQNNDLHKAEQWQTFVDEARKALKRGPYITPYKAALSILYNRKTGGARPPLRTLTDGESASLKEALITLNVLREKVR